MKVNAIKTEIPTYLNPVNLDEFRVEIDYNKEFLNNLDKDFIAITGSIDSKLLEIDRIIITPVNMMDKRDFDLYINYKDGFYDVNSLAADWSRNHEKNRVYRIIKNYTINTMSEILSISTGNKSMYKKSSIHIHNEFGRGRNTNFVHPILFINILYNIDPLIGIRAQIALFKHIDYNSMDTSKCHVSSFNITSNSKTKTYIAIDEKNLTYKIGKTSKDVFDRESALRNSNLNLSIIAFIERDIEKELHNKYRDYRISDSREWFSLTRDMVRCIIDEYRFNIPIIKKRFV